MDAVKDGRVREAMTTYRWPVVAGVTGLLTGCVITLGVLDALSGSESVDVNDSFTTEITAVTSNGRAICIDRPEDDCGVLVAAGDYVPQVGDAVTAVELWLKDDGVSTLAWYVTPR